MREFLPAILLGVYGALAFLGHGNAIPSPQPPPVLPPTSAIVVDSGHELDLWSGIPTRGIDGSVEKRYMRLSWLRRVAAASKVPESREIIRAEIFAAVPAPSTAPLRSVAIRGIPNTTDWTDLVSIPSTRVFAELPLDDTRTICTGIEPLSKEQFLLVVLSPSAIRLEVQQRSARVLSNAAFEVPAQRDEIRLPSDQAMEFCAVLQRNAK